VLGVLVPGVDTPSEGQGFDGGVNEFWKPFAIRDDDLAILAEFNYGCVGKLKPGVSVAQATADLNVIQNRIAKQVPEKVELQAVVTPLQKHITGGARQSLKLLLAASGMLLLIVVVNLANLLLARARQRELAIRRSARECRDWSGRC
jgi:putative ABC transport system permease protein